jgi:hypothetical protein
MLKTKWIGRATSLALAAGLGLLASGPALAQETGIATVGSDVFKASYFDVATSAAPSRAGYGGAGQSGGAGDNTVRIVNTTAANGTLCADIYVFDDFEELQTCCACPVTPDGLRTLSTVNDLTFHFGVNLANLNAGVVEVISSTPNFCAGSATPLATNCTSSIPGGTNGVCSPTGAPGDPFHRGVAIVPTAGLRAWITHDELLQPGAIIGGKAVQSASVEEFADSPLDSTHLSKLQSRCAFLIQNGSGQGICTCGAGENAIASAGTAAH